MKTSEQRAQHDDFELKAHYDFSQGIRGKFYRPQRLQTNVQLDQDLIALLQQHAQQQHIDYHSLINNVLRDYLKQQS